MTSPRTESVPSTQEIRQHGRPPRPAIPGAERSLQPVHGNMQTLENCSSTATKASRRQPRPEQCRRRCADLTRIKPAEIDASLHARDSDLHRGSVVHASAKATALHHVPPDGAGSRSCR